MRHLNDEIYVRIIEAFHGFDGLPRYEILKRVNLPAEQILLALQSMLKKGLLIQETYAAHAYYVLAEENAGLFVNSGMVKPKAEYKNEYSKNFQYARTCYGHIAGKVGVMLFYFLKSKKLISPEHKNIDYRLNQSGVLCFKQIAGIVLHPTIVGKHCLDRTERCYHLAGELGSHIAKAFISKGYFVRISGDRALHITPLGKKLVNDISQLP